MVELKSFLVMNGTKEEALGFIPSTTNQRRFRVALMLHEPPPSRKLFRRRQTTVFWGSGEMGGEVTSMGNGRFLCFSFLEH